MSSFSPSHNRTKMCLYFVLAATIFATVTVSLPFGHPCLLNTPLRIKFGEEFFMNMNCTKGTIYWHYPEGRIRLIFEQDYPVRDFDICLLNGGSVVYYNRAIDANTGKELPVKDEVTHCVQSSDGKVTLDFESDKMEFYMAIIDYQVRNYKGGRFSGLSD